MAKVLIASFHRLAPQKKVADQLPKVKKLCILMCRLHLDEKIIFQNEK